MLLGLPISVAIGWTLATPAVREAPVGAPAGPGGVGAGEIGAAPERVADPVTTVDRPAPRQSAASAAPPSLAPPHPAVATSTAPSATPTPSATVTTSPLPSLTLPPVPTPTEIPTTVPESAPPTEASALPSD